MYVKLRLNLGQHRGIVGKCVICGTNVLLHLEPWLLYFQLCSRLIAWESTGGWLRSVYPYTYVGNVE